MATEGESAILRSKYERRLAKLETEVLELKESIHRALNDLLPKVNDLLSADTSASSLVAPKERTSSNAPLFKAAVEGDEIALQQLLDEGELINQRNNEGDTVLHLVAAAGLKRIVVILLKRGCDFDIRGHCHRTPLLCAAALGHVEVLKCLYYAGANLLARDSAGNSALHLAARAGHLDVVREFCVMISSLNVTDHGGNSAMVIAAKAEQWNVVEFLVQKGASLGIFRGAGNDPYCLILKSRNYPLIHTVLKKIDAKESRIANGLIESNDPHLPSVIHECFPGFFNSEKGERVLNIVLRNGTAETLADILKLDVGIRPSEYYKYRLLANACILGKTDALKMLIDEGVNFNVSFSRDLDCTLLHYAAKYGHVDCVRVLIDAGVPLDCEDSCGTKPIDLTRKNEIIELLQIYS